MKAIRVSEYGGPSVLKLEETPTPSPGPNQVLVRNRAAGVNPVDTYLRANADNRGPKLPYTPGSDSAGVVEAVGAGVTGVKAGDRVYVGGTLSGAYAELSLCEPGQVHPLPDNVSFAQGAAMNVPYATAYHALFNRGHGQAGETVLVHGASGGVGIGAVQLARLRAQIGFYKSFKRLLSGWRLFHASLAGFLVVRGGDRPRRRAALAHHALSRRSHERSRYLLRPLR